MPKAELRQQHIIQETKNEKDFAINLKRTKLLTKLNKNDIRSFELASEKGASSWLNAMPLKRYHFDLKKAIFVMALPFAMTETQRRYHHYAHARRTSLMRMPSTVRKGDTRTLDNSFSDSIANMLTDICHDVDIEPLLQPLQGENFAFKSTTTDDDAKLVIKANGF